MIILNDWLKISETSGRGNAVITLTADYNNLGERSSYLTVKTRENSVIMSILQKYELFKLSHSLITSEWGGGVKTFTITTNISELTFDAPSWAGVSYERVGDIITCTVQFQENTSSNRNGEILIRNGGSIMGSVILAQGGDYDENEVIYYLTTSPTPTVYNTEGIVSHQFEGNFNGIKVGCIYYNDAVVDVPDNLFFNDTYIQAVSFPDSVKSIGESAFEGCYSLSSVEFPSMLEGIGARCFYECKALQTLILPSTLSTIGNYAFSLCDIEDVTLPDSIKTIGNGAFSFCEGLRSITLPSELESIGDAAFLECKGLQSLEIYENGATFGNGIFETCNNLTHIKILQGNGTKPSITKYTFFGVGNDGILEAPVSSDYNNWLSKEMYYLGYYKWNLVNYGEPEIPEIPDSENIIITIDSTEIDYKGGVITFVVNYENCDEDKISNVITNHNDVVVTRVGNWRYSANGVVGDYSINVTEYPIGRDIELTFSMIDYQGSKHTKTLTITQTAYVPSTGIPNNEIHYTSTDGNVVTPYRTNFGGANIVSNTYENGKGIIRFDRDIIIFGDDVFYRRETLKTIDIPSSVTEIGGDAFYYTSLETVTCRATTAPTVDESAFQYIIGNGVLYYPLGSDYSSWLSTDDYYLGSSFWFSTPINDIPNNEIHYISTDGNVVEPNGSFSGKDGYNTVYRNIVSNTYENGKGIIKFDGDITSIGSGVFYDCNTLKQIVIPNSVNSIGENTFYHNDSLEEVTLPNALVGLSNINIFKYCTSLKRIIIPEGVASIGDSCFYESSLEWIMLPSTLTYVGDSAFYSTPLQRIICKATTAPRIDRNTTFKNVYNQGVLLCPDWTEYSSTWLSKQQYALGYYNWAGVNLVPE